MVLQQHVQLTLQFLQAANLAQEFVIKNTLLEDKVNQLLPSQGGSQAGVDLSASTMIVPVVNLTEAAEGSVLRQDLQTALSHNTATVFNVSNTTTTVVNTTGYWRVIGTLTLIGNSGGTESASIILSDGVTDKIVFGASTGVIASGRDNTLIEYDFVIFLAAGESLKMTTSDNTNFLIGSVRQLADINGNLVNP